MNFNTINADLSKFDELYSTVSGDGGALSSAAVPDGEYATVVEDVILVDKLLQQSVGRSGSAAELILA